MTDSGSMSSVRISTDAFPERARLALWREIYGRNIVNVDIEPLDDRPFHASVLFHALPGLGVAIGSRSDASCIGSRRGLAKTQDQVILTLATKGEYCLAQLGREIAGGPGSGALLSGADPGSATLRGDGAFVTLAFPRAALQALVPDLGAVLARPIPASNEALRLLTGYLRVFKNLDGPMSPAASRAFATHVLDLTALAVGACGESGEIAACARPGSTPCCG